MTVRCSFSSVQINTADKHLKQWPERRVIWMWCKRQFSAQQCYFNGLVINEQTTSLVRYNTSSRNLYLQPLEGWISIFGWHANRYSFQLPTDTPVSQPPLKRSDKSSKPLRKYHHVSSIRLKSKKKKKSKKNGYMKSSNFFSVARESKFGPGRHIAEVSRLHTITHTHTHTHKPGRAPLNEWPVRYRGYTYTTDEQTCPQRDSNLQSQQSSGRRPAP